jgi:hypothetical protein
MVTLHLVCLECTGRVNALLAYLPVRMHVACEGRLARFLFRAAQGAVDRWEGVGSLARFAKHFVATVCHLGCTSVTHRLLADAARKL